MGLIVLRVWSVILCRLAEGRISGVVGGSITGVVGGIFTCVLGGSYQGGTAGSFNRGSGWRHNSVTVGTSNLYGSAPI